MIEACTFETSGGFHLQTEACTFETSGRLHLNYRSMYIRNVGKTPAAWSTCVTARVVYQTGVCLRVSDLRRESYTTRASSKDLPPLTYTTKPIHNNYRQMRRFIQPRMRSGIRMRTGRRPLPPTRKLRNWATVCRICFRKGFGSKLYTAIDGDAYTDADAETYCNDERVIYCEFNVLLHLTAG
jgi:hypothetical protein